MCLNIFDKQNLISNKQYDLEVHFKREKAGHFTPDQLAPAFKKRRCLKYFPASCQKCPSLANGIAM